MPDSAEPEVWDLSRTTVHTFRARLKNAPGTDVAKDWHTNAAVISPNYLEVNVAVERGEQKRAVIDITGPTTRKDGKLSENHRRGTFVMTPSTKYEPHPTAPKWLKDLVSKILIDADMEAK